MKSFYKKLSLRDIFQYNFFSLLKERDNIGEKWTDEDLRYLDFMQRICKKGYSDRETHPYRYEWAFATCNE